MHACMLMHGCAFLGVGAHVCVPVFGVCLYAHVSACICVCMYTGMWVCICMCACVCMTVCRHLCMHVFVLICMHMYMCVHVFMAIHACACVGICVHMCVCTSVDHNRSQRSLKGMWEGKGCSLWSLLRWVGEWVASRHAVNSTQRPPCRASPTTDCPLASVTMKIRGEIILCVHMPIPS